MQPSPTERRSDPPGPAAARLRDAWWRRFAIDVRSLAVFRVGLGLVLLADAALRTRDFNLMFAADGIFPPHLIRGYLDDDPTHWSLALLRDESWWAAGVLALEAAAGCCLAAGWRTTIVTVVAWVAQGSVYRRTMPAANAGDVLLSCLLFWSCFLPLGAIWSVDGRRRPGGSGGGRPTAVCGIATTALVLQVMAVYLGAGLAKWNPTWLGGEALRYALSVHDHGTPLGTWLTAAEWLMPPLTWSVLGAELLAPLVFLAWPASRPLIVPAFMLFHVFIWLTMSVGLFAPIGLVAWLPLLPGSLWGLHRGGPAPPGIDCPSPAARWACAGALPLMALSFVHDCSRWRDRPLPRPLRQAIHACGLTQQWGMFGTVPPCEQWAYTRAELADGRLVDILRGGRPVQVDRPAGGFTSLPHHRWHKLLWILPQPKARVFAPSVAATLARDWNARHEGADRVVSLELRFARRTLSQSDPTVGDMLVGSWPERTAAGAGNLDRFLQGPAAEEGR